MLRCRRTSACGLVGCVSTLKAIGATAAADTIRPRGGFTASSDLKQGANMSMSYISAIGRSHFSTSNTICSTCAPLSPGP